jgi:hypothetical protein
VESVLIVVKLAVQLVINRPVSVAALAKGVDRFWTGRPFTPSRLLNDQKSMLRNR